ncbi:MAG: putative lipopolysaccharide heptosyltransferase III [Betaproteobacteria bacterium]|nr:putative lipopolysaccharide heptosyltransferase III [Betaproteobacteria bacterium]
MSPSDPDPTRLQRVLVTKLRHHGDVLLAAPVIGALARHAPQAQIDALVYAETAPMLLNHPGLSQVHRIDRAWKRSGPWRQALAEWRLLRALRARRYDLVVHLSVHPRGAWLVRLLRPRWSVGPELSRPGRHAWWRNSFTHRYPAQSHPERHTVETNLDSLRALGLPIGEADKAVTLVAGAPAESAIDQRLAALGLPRGGFIHVHPMSRWRFKCWPSERVAALCETLAARGWPVVITAAPDPQELALIAQVLARCPAAGGIAPRIHDLSGKLSLEELAALTARARLFVGVDSAPMHMAAAVGTPTVGIFGPSRDREWGPWGQPMSLHRVVASTEHACRPCGRAGCQDSKVSDCLVTLPERAVLRACEELLGTAPAPLPAAA